MSKLDAQRAMREAKYARDRASGPTRREAAATGCRTPQAMLDRCPAPRPAKSPASPSRRPSRRAATERCGHRSMNGRSCTRDAGHSEYSHRYS